MPQLSESVESIDHRPDSRPIPANPEQRRTGKIPSEMDSVDDDLFKLLNLIQKPNQRYLHASFQIPASWQKKSGILTIVGGSYMSAILDSLDSAKVFERMNHYSYFRDSRHRFPDNVLDPVDENAIPWEEDFWNTRAVVLEANEEAMSRRHLPAFLRPHWRRFSRIGLKNGAWTILRDRFPGDLVRAKTGAPWQRKGSMLQNIS